MSYTRKGAEAKDYALAKQLGVNLRADNATIGGRFIARFNHKIPGAVYLDEATQYRAWQLDYFSRNTGKLMLSRIIAEVPPGGHTEPAYWFRPTRQPLEVHQGRGELVMASPDDAGLQRIALEPTIRTLRSDLPRILPEHFYAIQAEADATDPLVVSSVYAAPIDWDKYEVALEPRADTLTVPAGAQPERDVMVPTVFLEHLAGN